MSVGKTAESVCRLPKCARRLSRSRRSGLKRTSRYLSKCPTPKSPCRARPRSVSNVSGEPVQISDPLETNSPGSVALVCHPRVSATDPDKGVHCEPNHVCAVGRAPPGVRVGVHLENRLIAVAIADRPRKPDLHRPFLIEITQHGLAAAQPDRDPRPTIGSLQRAGRYDVRP